MDMLFGALAATIALKARSMKQFVMVATFVALPAAANGATFVVNRYRRCRGRAAG